MRHRCRWRERKRREPGHGDSRCGARASSCLGVAGYLFYGNQLTDERFDYELPDRAP